MGGVGLRALEGARGLGQSADMQGFDTPKET